MLGLLRPGTDLLGTLRSGRPAIVARRGRHGQRVTLVPGPARAGRPPDSTAGCAVRRRRAGRPSRRAGTAAAVGASTQWRFVAGVMVPLRGWQSRASLQLGHVDAGARDPGQLHRDKPGLRRDQARPFGPGAAARSPWSSSHGHGRARPGPAAGGHGAGGPGAAPGVGRRWSTGPAKRKGPSSSPPWCALAPQDAATATAATHDPRKHDASGRCPGQAEAATSPGITAEQLDPRTGRRPKLPVVIAVVIAARVPAPAGHLRRPGAALKAAAADCVHRRPTGCWFAVFQWAGPARRRG